MSLTSLSVKRPTLIVVIFTVLAFFGLISYSGLQYELLPKMDTPIVTITTIYPGAGPGEVENSVTKKIENEISSIENIEQLQSFSMEGVSMIVIQLFHGTDVDLALQSAQRKVNAIRATLPEDVKDPTLDKFSFSDLPILRIGVTSSLTPIELNDLLDNNIQPDFARVEGVAKVSIVGSTEREIRVNANPKKLESYGISMLQVTQAIANANIDFPTGKVKSTEGQYLVRLSGKFSDIEQIRDLVVMNTPDGNPIYLSDVADVYDGTKDVETISRINGEPSVAILITKQTDGNAVAVSEKVREKISELEEIYKKEGLKFNISSDTSTFTLEAADAVIHDLIMAVILVAVIMLFFLHSIKNAFIVMVSIPLSIVSTFIVMDMMGFSLNLMTLLALSLVVGILVDDSIVVLENIYSHLEEGLSPKEAAIKCWDEIGLSVSSITLVIVVVFLPLAFMDGMMSDMMRAFAIVVAAATAISLLVSFTVTPLLASRFSKLTHLDENKMLDKPLIWFENFLESIKNGYASILKFTLRHKLITMVSIFAMIIGSFSLMAYGFIGSEFVNAGDNGEFIITAELPKDATIEQTNAISLEVEKHMFTHKEMVSVFTTVGTVTGMMTGSQSVPNQVEFNGKLVPALERSMSSKDFGQMVKKELFYKFPGVKFKSKEVGIAGGNDAPIQMVVQGADLNGVFAFTDTLVKVFKTVPGAVEIELSVEAGNPEVKVDIDRKRMADLGLSMGIVGATMQNAFAGNTDSKYREGQNEYDINVMMDEFNRESVDDIKGLSFMNNAGQLIRMEQFATVSLSSGPSKLERVDKIPSVTIKAQVAGRPVGTVSTEIEEKVQAMKKPIGINAFMNGDIKRQNEAMSSMGAALGISIVLVYLIMVALYESYVYPFVVMFSVPVAIIGALLALAINLQNMSVFAMLGVIMLVGLVIKNAILIVDFTNHLKERGIPFRQAIIDASLSRFRPILMTTIAMVIAMIPVAIAKGAGAEWKNSLAWVLIGGLTSSMILTLIVVPIMYYVVDAISEKLDLRKKRRSGEISAESPAA